VDGTLQIAEMNEQSFCSGISSIFKGREQPLSASGCSTSIVYFPAVIPLRGAVIFARDWQFFHGEGL